MNRWSSRAEEEGRRGGQERKAELGKKPGEQGRRAGRQEDRKAGEEGKSLLLISSLRARAGRCSPRNHFQVKEEVAVVVLMTILL